MSDSYTALDLLELTDANGTWILSDFANGSVAELTAPNALSAMTTGYNGNGMASHNEPGRQRTLNLRLIKGSEDDKRINSTFELWKARDSRFKPFEGKFTKNIGHSDGSITNDTTTCYFGIPAEPPSTYINTEGDTDQVVSTYTITFANYDRNM